MLDVAAFDGYLLMKMDGYRDSRKVYLKNLARQLAAPSAILRNQTNLRLPLESKQAAVLLNFVQFTQVF